MSFVEYTIKFNSVSVPSIRGETEIELTLSNDEGKWYILRQLGFGYSKEPTKSRLQLNSEEVEEIINHLSNVSLSVLPEWIEGLDGTTYSLKIFCGLNSVVYEWWEELPKGYKALELVIEKLFNWANLDLKEMYEQ
jgi:hypothetical protein